MCHFLFGRTVGIGHVAAVPISDSSIRMTSLPLLLVLLATLSNAYDQGTLTQTFTLSSGKRYAELAAGSNYYWRCSPNRKNGDYVDDLDIYYTGPDGSRLSTSAAAGVRVEEWPNFPKAGLFLSVNESLVQGTYKCVMTAGGETVESEIYLILVVPLKVWAPEFQIAAEGAKKTLLKCGGTITEAFRPGITWFKVNDDGEWEWLANNNEWIDPIEPRYKVTFEGLEISNVTSADAADYVCRWHTAADSTFATASTGLVVGLTNE